MSLTTRVRNLGRVRLLLGCASLVLATVVPLTVFGAAAQEAPGPAQILQRGDDENPRRDVMANLFEWNWHSVANECVTVLGPKGYGGVQVAPPQDSVFKTDGPVHPWWEVYQPVDYNLTSRMGTEAQFGSMVATCRSVGVRVYVDAVINHMTGQGNVSYGGGQYTHFNYPGVYSDGDFHHTPADCPSADGGVDDFNNYLQVTRCELLGLADLRTESDHVRATIAAYLNKLIGYGVSGFRVDAAKHIGQADLAAIEARLNRTADGTRPYIALEVFPGGPGKLAPAAFQTVGNLLGFDFAYQLHDAFKSYTTPPGGNITELQVFGENSGLLPSGKELVFVENHDTERNGSTLSYKDGALNVLATQFMLARGHGRPQVYAGFNFTGSDDSPPSDATGRVSDTDCNNGWTCTDRFVGVANMVGWHNYVGDAPIANWYDDGVNLIAFSRGNRGWITINNQANAISRTFATGLRGGTYCDLIHSSDIDGPCAGHTVTVDANGNATVTVPARDSVALDGANLVSGRR
jgi:alpha-amylase